MKSLLSILVVVAVAATISFAQYPRVTIRQIQEVPADSLLKADTLQNSVPARWTLQASPYVGDTVTVTALCVVPPKVITYTAAGYTMILYDTTAAGPWGGLLVRVNAPGDTAQIILDGFLSVEAGDIIEMTGLISEFPTLSMNSITQFQPIAGDSITILSGGNPLPPPFVMKTGDFYKGLFSAGKTQYSTGEPLEGMYVELHNLTVDGRPNTTRGTFTMVDSSGNQIFEYDMSHFFTFGHGSTLPFPEDTTWRRIYPPVGATIDTIRGIISTASGGENNRGYRIAPLYRSDLVIGIVLPSLTTHRRNPVVVSPDSVARISVRALKQQGGYGVRNTFLRYSLNNAPFVTDTMKYQASDTTYNGTIPKQVTGTFVRYFVQVFDSAGYSVTMASSASGGVGADTSSGFFFYTVLNRPLTIYDIEYTPYINGRSPYLGATATIGGIVTADTSHISISPLSNGGTNSWYIQSTSQPWSGLWVTGIDPSLLALKNGDSVSVTGTVQEQFDVTRINVTAPVVVRATGLPEPEPVSLTTGAFKFGVPNGSPTAEPYEGMLVRFTNVDVTNLSPTFSDPTEFSVDDSSGAIVVRRDGKNSYTNIEAEVANGKTFIPLNKRISSLTGIIYYSYNQYKIAPRTDADFGTITGVQEHSKPVLPTSYAMAQNYPNPFNPTTTIEYTLPAAGNVTLKVYNLLGQEVRTLVNAYTPAGYHSVRFDSGALSSGLYFYRIQAGPFSAVKKMLVVK
jgi:hypothetical protein